MLQVSHEDAAVYREFSKIVRADRLLSLAWFGLVPLSAASCALCIAVRAGRGSFAVGLLLVFLPGLMFLMPATALNLSIRSAIDAWDAQAISVWRSTEVRPPFAELLLERLKAKRWLAMLSALTTAVPLGSLSYWIWVNSPRALGKVLAIAIAAVLLLAVWSVAATEFSRKQRAEDLRSTGAIGALSCSIEEAFGFGANGSERDGNGLDRGSDSSTRRAASLETGAASSERETAPPLEPPSCPMPSQFNAANVRWLAGRRRTTGVDLLGPCVVALSLGLSAFGVVDWMIGWLGVGLGGTLWIGFTALPVHLWIIAARVARPPTCLDVVNRQ